MFQLLSPYQPTGDQPQAIEKLTAGVRNGRGHQVLLGVTGSGKTFTMANVIANIGRPTLVISHNKTLAAQLYQEYRDYFPHNAVGYFVSYYDYYQPEAYIPQTDTYIEKETDVNELIDKLRLQATTNLMTRKDVIIVASVSCIYNIGSPTEYERRVATLSVGEPIDRRVLFEQLADLQYTRNEVELVRGSFRVRGDTIDIWPAYEDKVARVSLIGDSVGSIIWVDPISAQPLSADAHLPLTSLTIYPAKHYLTNPAEYREVFAQIRSDLALRVKELEAAGKFIEAHRLSQRVNYDLEMLLEVGYVNGIENYSRYFDGRMPGEAPHTLLDYFKACDPNFLVVIDESHMSIPQIRGMYNGDKARKQALIDYGFRLPAAVDNRPLTLDEFLTRAPQSIYTSATPNEWEITVSGAGGVVEQLIRPTGLIDPEVEIRPLDRQVPDLVIEVMRRKSKGQRVLVTTLTKKTAEALSEHLNNPEKISEIIKQYQQSSDVQSNEFSLSVGSFPSVTYLHADIHTLDRQDILDQLRSGGTDVLIGINLLREGLDLPEVSLVAILDADQEGFLRSRTSLIQTMGRAARHIEGKVILYANQMTRSMQAAIEEVNRRRSVQVTYNLQNNIMPTGINKPIREKLIERPPEETPSVQLPPTITKRYRVDSLEQLDIASLMPPDRNALVRHLNKQMLEAADRLDFETAAKLRDKVNEIKSPAGPKQR